MPMVAGEQEPRPAEVYAHVAGESTARLGPLSSAVSGVQPQRATSAPYVQAHGHFLPGGQARQLDEPIRHDRRGRLSQAKGISCRCGIRLHTQDPDPSAKEMREHK